MCELLAMSSSRPSHLTFSLQALTEHSVHGSRDGWGAAFYAGRDVALFREPEAASGSALVSFLQNQGPSTTLAISHIRHATMGEVALANTQPFVREMAGRMHTFVHNGNLPGIKSHPRFAEGRFRSIGDTDSEHAFCILHFAGPYPRTMGDHRSAHAGCAAERDFEIFERTASTGTRQFFLYGQ